MQSINYMSSSIILDVEVDEARRQCFIEIHRSAYDKLGFTNKGLSIASVEWNEHFSTKEHKKGMQHLRLLFFSLCWYKPLFR